MTFAGAPDFLQVSRNVIAKVIDITPVTIPANSSVTNTYNYPQTGDVVTVFATGNTSLFAKVQAQDVSGNIVQSLAWGFTTALDGDTVAIEPRGGPITLTMYNNHGSASVVTLTVIGYIGAALDDVVPRSDSDSQALGSVGPASTPFARLLNVVNYPTLNYFAYGPSGSSSLVITESIASPVITGLFGFVATTTTIAIPAVPGFIRGSQPIAGSAIRAQVTTTAAGGDNMAVALKAYR